MALDLDLSAADVLSGMHGVISVLGALRMRDAGGVGQHIDMAMIDAMTFSADIIVNVLDGARRSESINGEGSRTEFEKNRKMNKPRGRQRGTPPK